MLKVTSVKQPPVFKGQHFVIPNVHFNSEMNCITKFHAVEGHFTLSLF